MRRTEESLSTLYTKISIVALTDHPVVSSSDHSDVLKSWIQTSRAAECLLIVSCSSCSKKSVANPRNCENESNRVKHTESQSARPALHSLRSLPVFDKALSLTLLDVATWRSLHVQASQGKRGACSRAASARSTQCSSESGVPDVVSERKRAEMLCQSP